MVSASSGRDYLPGGSQFYSFGVSQSEENFENVKRAQSTYNLYSKEKYWQDVKPSRAPGFINQLQSYYPLSVRWELKDGRQFIANIDVRAVMQEYFKSNDLRMQWHIERREKAKSGDGYSSFVHEVKDDTVVLKWLVPFNDTPVSDRFTSTGAATPWKVRYEDHIVTEIKGTPTRGIDFDKWVDISK